MSLESSSGRLETLPQRSDAVHILAPAIAGLRPIGRVLRTPAPRHGVAGPQIGQFQTRDGSAVEGVRADTYIQRAGDGVAERASRLFEPLFGRDGQLKRRCQLR